LYPGKSLEHFPFGNILRPYITGYCGSGDVLLGGKHTQLLKGHVVHTWVDVALPTFLQNLFAALRVFSELLLFSPTNINEILLKLV
jgi:hypothetical protein